MASKGGPYPARRVSRRRVEEAAFARLMRQRRHEVRGNYLWSPKRNANGGRNPFYDFMREVAPGNVVLSFADTRIKAIGFVVSHAYEAPKPLEFGEVGAYWETIGWRVDVRFTELQLPIRPADHMGVLAPLLPRRYSPLRPTGGGLQNIYLTLLPETLASSLIDLIGIEARNLIGGYRVGEELPIQPAIGLIEWEEHEMSRLREDLGIPETERQAVVLARRGQGLFKQRVMQIESACRITSIAKST